MKKHEKIGPDENGRIIVRQVKIDISIKKHEELSEELLKIMSGFIFDGIAIYREKYARYIGNLFYIYKWGGGSSTNSYFNKNELDLISYFCDKHDLLYEMRSENKLVIKIKE